MNKKKLRIVQVNTIDNTGGAARIALNLHQELEKRGYDSFFAVGEKQSIFSGVIQIPHNQRFYKIEKKIAEKFKKIPGLRILTHTNSVGNPIMNIFHVFGIEDFYYPGTSDLLHLLPSGTPDIIHCHNLHGGYFDLRLLPDISDQIPVVITLHDAWLLSGYCPHSFDCERWKIGCGKCPYLGKFSEIYADSTKRNLSRKKQIISKSHLYVVTPCQWLMDKVNQSVLQEGIVAKKVIPNGVNLTIFHPYDKKSARMGLGLPIDVNLILFAANGIRNSIHKDYGTLYSTLSVLASSGMKILCLALGEEAPNEYFHGIEIRFIPYLNDPNIVAQYYQAADLYVHPACAETFPNTILEALACGTPVIASAVGGIPEQIKEGITGFLVPLGDVKKWTKIIPEILYNKKYRQQLGKQAAIDAEKRFGLGRMIDEYLQLYWEIYHKKRE